VSADQAAYDIAEGLARVITFADEPTNPRYQEGIGMLRNGIREALEFLEPPRSMTMRTRIE